MEKQRATDTYLNEQGALSYLDFINSEDGKIFQQAQSGAVLARLNKSISLQILDAGCGPGWLTKKLSDEGYNAVGCDASPLFINYAKVHYPNINFQISDLTQSLPYGDGQFDAVILSMAALDLNDQAIAFKNLRRVLKPQGQLLVTTVNPYYGYPVGLWKRGLWGFIFRKFPKLKLKPYMNFARSQDRKFWWSKNKLASYFYTLPEQVNALIGAGFELRHMADIGSTQDDKKYSLRFRLYRFPVYILLELKKPK